MAITACGDEYTEEDKEALHEAEKGYDSTITQEVWGEFFEQHMPEVEKAIEERIEEYAKEKVDERIEKGTEREAGSELTPEKAESLLRREYYEWPKEVREEIIEHIYKDEKGPSERPGMRTIGRVKTDLYIVRDKITGEVIRERLMDTITLYKQTPKQAVGTAIHEHAEVDYKVMPENLREQFEKEIWSTTDKEKELEFFKGELYGASPDKGNPHVFEGPNNNYAFWMTAFRLNAIGLESYERMRELKEINPAKFNFCKERCVAHEIARAKEKLYGE